jgi:hypothetical protein
MTTAPAAVDSGNRVTMPSLAPIAMCKCRLANQQSNGERHAGKKFRFHIVNVVI